MWTIVIVMVGNSDGCNECDHGGIVEGNYGDNDDDDDGWVI